MMIAEHVLDHLAAASGADPIALRAGALYAENDETHFGQALAEGTWNVPRAWETLRASAAVEARRAELAEFNKAHRWRKRGLAMLPTKFGINFTAKFMNQVCSGGARAQARAAWRLGAAAEAAARGRSAPPLARARPRTRARAHTLATLALTTRAQPPNPNPNPLTLTLTLPNPNPNPTYHTTAPCRAVRSCTCTRTARCW